MTRRRPYDAAAVREWLADTSMWHDVRVVASTGSTSSDLVELARAGAAEGTVLVADHQRSGRGRLDRAWLTPPGTAIAASLLFGPSGVPATRWPWLPLAVGVAVVEAVGEVAAVCADLKWPNDVLVDGRKLAGILAEVVPGAGGAHVVVGLGLNVSVAVEDLPRTATSLALAGAPDVDRAHLLGAILDRIEAHYVTWRAGDGDPEPVLAAYRPLCGTLGSLVEVTLPTGEVLSGRAVDVDTAGRLVVRTAESDRALSVGDVVHVR